LPQLRSEREADFATDGAVPRRVSKRLESPCDSQRKLKPGPGMPSADVADHQRVRIQRALIEIVAEQGYRDLTVRELAGKAAVSTRTFYQHYAGKEDCFLRTHELLVRRVLGQLAGSRRSLHDPSERLQCVARALIEEWDSDPQAARLMLIEAYAAGAAAEEQARRAMGAIAEQIRDCFDGTNSASLLADGIVAGLVGVMRPRLRADEAQLPANLADHLSRWVISYCSPLVTELDELDRIARLRLQQRNSLRSDASSKPGEGEAMAPFGDRALLLSAVAKLAAADGYEGLTPRKVLVSAGIPRRSFYANFANVEECLFAAIELQASEAMADAKRAGKKGQIRTCGVYRAISALCVRVANDPVFANLCLGGIATVGQQSLSVHQRLMSDLGGLADDLSAERSISELALEASAAALWGVLENEVRRGRARRAVGATATLSYLLLAPIVGASPAVEAIRRELSNQPGRRSNHHGKK
jgi:AcrR family transcriptional regulator